MESRASPSAAAMVSIPTGPPPNCLGDQRQIAPVEGVQAPSIDFQPVQRGIGGGGIDRGFLGDGTAKSRTRLSKRPEMRGVPRGRWRRSRGRRPGSGQSPKCARRAPTIESSSSGL